MNIAADITQLIGKTPLVQLNRISQHLPVKIYAKLESRNPLASIKDRISLAMIEDAEKQGQIRADSIIIEPTSGNTGIGLAYICAVKGYRLILTMPETMSIERRKLLHILGAELVLTEGTNGMRGAVERAEQLVNEYPNGFMLQQFRNEANPEIHRKTTALEIWNDTDGTIDIFIAGVGTGGTISGVGEMLKQKKPKVQIIAVEPTDSPVLSGGRPGPHKIQGIGAGFIPDILNRKIIDEIMQVEEVHAAKTTRQLARMDGILAGISSGAAVWAALEIGKRPENQGKSIVVILPDSGERYLSTWLFDED